MKLSIVRILTLTTTLALAGTSTGWAQGTASNTAIMLTVEQQLDAMKSDIASATFRNKEQAITETQSALNRLRQAKAGAQALAGSDGATRVGPYAEAQFLLSDMESSLLTQLAALYADDNAMYQEAKLNFNALYTEVPTIVRMQPITQGDGVIDPVIPPQPK